MSKQGNPKRPRSSGAEKAMAENNPDFDITRFFAGLKLPAIPDMGAFTAATRRNMEALTAANRIALEAAQAVARREMEIMQQAMSDMSEAMRSVSGAESPQDDRTARQAELLKQGYERAVKNLRELSDMIQRANQEAVDHLSRRFTEALDEQLQGEQK
jgi:phasin family protein